MTGRLVFAALVVAYVGVVIPFSNYLAEQPLSVKLGYSAPPNVVKVLSGEHRTTNASLMVSKVIFYYGTLLQEFSENRRIPPEYYNMFKTLEGAVWIDPYNLDSYYFSQAVFTWDIGQVKEVNRLLERGVEYRTWDPWLPFFIGFNHAYFLKDPKAAAPFMEKAAQRSANPLFTGLTTRYFYEADQSEVGLSFLEEMIKQTNHPALRRSYEVRRDALKAIAFLQKAQQEFQRHFGAHPDSIEAMVEAGFLPAIPVDPYGGTFYINAEGQIRSTSNLVLLSKPPTTK